jgi:hypothetical protein
MFVFGAVAGGAAALHRALRRSSSAGAPKAVDDARTAGDAPAAATADAGAKPKPTAAAPGGHGQHGDVQQPQQQPQPQQQQVLRSSGPTPPLRAGALVKFCDGRGMGLVLHPTGHGEWCDLAPTCSSNGVLRLRVGDLSYCMAEAAFLVEDAGGGLLAFRAVG